MATGFSVDFLWYPIGTEDFVHAFFSTISYRLEPNGWGTKYPFLMNHLYQGKLEWVHVPEAIQEVHDVRKHLEEYSPSDIVWDIEDLRKQPPWGNDISKEISSLANYFVTGDGKDLFEVLLKVLDISWSEKIDVEIQTL